jgi:hypothetical protein
LSLRSFLTTLLVCVAFNSQLAAQAAFVRIGQEVRAYNDSTHTVISGRVTAVSPVHLAIARALDAPPVKIDWANIHRLEVKKERAWVQVTLASDQLADSTVLFGRVDGAKAARDARPGSQFGAAFLGGLPLGFFGLWLFCTDCDATPKLGAAAGGVIIGLTFHDARKKARQLPPEVERLIRDKSPGYQAGFRESYAATLSSRLNTQAFAGATLGTAAGFVALLYLLQGYD